MDAELLRQRLLEAESNLEMQRKQMQWHISESRRHRKALKEALRLIDSEDLDRAKASIAQTLSGEAEAAEETS